MTAIMIRIITITRRESQGHLPSATSSCPSDTNAMSRTPSLPPFQPTRHYVHVGVREEGGWVGGLGESQGREQRGTPQNSLMWVVAALKISH